MIRLSFHGAAGEVTGSCALVESDRARVIVDYGMYQGGVQSHIRNRRPPPLDPGDIDAVIVTHGHLDHCGRLPLLTRDGYAGRIFTTPASVDLSAIILRDAAQLQEADADQANRRRIRRGGRTVIPLYNKNDVESCLPRFSSVPYSTRTQVAPGVHVTFFDAGHILGSSSVELTVERHGRPQLVILFSGDIGVLGSPFLRDPELPTRADAVILESTYGNREHRSHDETIRELAEIIHMAARERGRIIIPAFAIGRTQDIVFHISRLLHRGEIPRLPVYIDSPMALAATTLYRKHTAIFDEETRSLIASGESPLNMPGLHLVRTREESQRLNDMPGPCIIISASGMADGGRVVHHLRHSLWRPETHVVFVGFQAEGTLGRQIVSGAKMVRILGENIAVKARIHTLGGFSAHAGQGELLLWLGAVAPLQPRVFLNHGENTTRVALRDRIKDRFALDATLPQYGDEYDLD